MVKSISAVVGKERGRARGGGGGGGGGGRGRKTGS